MLAPVALRKRSFWTTFQGIHFKFLLDHFLISGLFCFESHGLFFQLGPGIFCESLQPQSFTVQFVIVFVFSCSTFFFLVKWPQRCLSASCTPSLITQVSHTLSWLSLVIYYCRFIICPLLVFLDHISEHGCGQMREIPRQGQVHGPGWKGVLTYSVVSQEACPWSMCSGQGTPARRPLGLIRNNVKEEALL